MYVPPMYHVDDPGEIRALIRGNPLATLVTIVDGAPEASHVPVIVDPGDPGSGPLRLCGHMNRMNPQWETVASGCPALLVFTGPHGYVSPVVYGFTPAAPTWNFTAVHASGPVSAVSPGPPTMAVITSTVEALERGFGAGWDMRESLGYFRELAPGVGAFAMRVERLQAIKKLSQEQDPHTRELVADSFARQGGERQRALAALMRRCPAPGAGAAECDRQA